MTILNLKLVSDLQLSPKSTQLHPAFTDIQRMGEMALVVSGDPQAHRHDRFVSLPLPFACAESTHVLPLGPGVCSCLCLPLLTVTRRAAGGSSNLTVITVP